MRTTPGSHRQLEIPTGIKWVSLFNPYIARIVDNGLVVFYTLSASTPSQDKNPSLSGHSDDALTRIALTNNPQAALLCQHRAVPAMHDTNHPPYRSLLHLVYCPHRRHSTVPPSSQRLYLGIHCDLQHKRKLIRSRSSFSRSLALFVVYYCRLHIGLYTSNPLPLMLNREEFN